MSQLPKYFIIALVLVILLWGMFLFNLDEKVLALMQPQKNTKLESSKINDNLKAEFESHKNNFAGTIKTKNQQEKDEFIKEEYTDSTTLLEMEKFYLKGSGQASIKSKRSFTPVEIDAELLPVKGTKLANFDLVNAKIMVGENSYDFNKGTAVIQKSKFTLNIISDVENSIFFHVTGLIDFKIKDNVYNGKVIFDDERFYIYESGNGQFQLSDYMVTITSTP